MGFIYEYGTNRLVCDACGTVGARKRRCPVGYCPPAALCGECYRTEKVTGAWAEAHASCPRLHAEYAALQAEREAHPDKWARSAVGDWHDSVPAGMVEVTTYAGTVHLVPKAQYDSTVPGFGA